MKKIEFICDACKKIIISSEPVETLISVIIEFPAENPVTYHLCDSCMKRFKSIIARTFI